MVHFKRLSDKKIRSQLKPGLYSDGLGLYLRVGTGNAKSWIYRYRTGGRLRDMGLGPLHTVPLVEARRLAEELRVQRQNKTDPLAERQQAATAATPTPPKTVITFEQCAKEYIASHASGWKNAKHAAQWTSTLETYVYPVFKKTSVEDIDVHLVMKVLQPIWNKKTETASRVRGRVERILDWARVKNLRSGDNPARWQGHLSFLLSPRNKVAKVVHHAALPIDETPPFMARLRSEDSVTARALEFCILTASRTSETLEMKWDELDFENRLWTVPADRMKAAREHRVPLSARSLTILAEMQKLRFSDYVFPGLRRNRPLSNSALGMTLERHGQPDVTAHGFRSTFRDWAAERTDFANEVVEMALAHTISNKVEAAYRRGDLFEKRRNLAQAWADFCDPTAL